MKNKDFGKELEERTLKFGIVIIKISVQLPNTPEGRVIRTQITKSGTSVGANYREANRSRSKADFRNKISICLSEASETQYWLNVIKETKFYTKDDFQEIYNECCELLALFTSIHTNTK